MKNTIEFLKDMILAVVYPDRILSLFRVKNLDQNSSKILGNDRLVKVLAFILAVAFVISVRYTPAPSLIYTRTVENVPVEVRIDDGYTAFGSPIPATVDVVLSGSREQINVFELTNTLVAYVDLTGFEEGMFPNVFIRVEDPDGQITASPTVNMVPGEVIVDRIESIEFPIAPPLLVGLPEISNRFDYRIEPEEEFVTLTGASRFLADVFVVRTTLDAEDVLVESGNTTLGGNLVVDDAAGEPVMGIDIYPASIRFRLEIFEVTRTIEIEVDSTLSQRPARFQSISVTADPTEIQVWGDFFDMAPVLTLPRISYHDLDDDGRVRVPLAPLLPEGVYSEIEEIEVIVVYEISPPPEEDDDD
ncbi:MAG: CdaR family protein [Turicibacter sp.]|nr:CdaR family protein [Turicibacter sp.]